MYKINELSKIAGISTRTLRYYDSIGLLSPSTVGPNHYRLYDATKVDVLQQILFYKELGFSLNQINHIIHDPSFNIVDALYEHRKLLIKKKERLTLLLDTVNKTIQREKGERQMTDIEKFEGFKESLLKENEERYGKEAREKYGDEEVNYSINQIKKMTKKDFQKASQLEKRIMQKLQKALQAQNPTSTEANELCQLHQQWIQIYWKTYSEEAHLSLVKMYIIDERFKAYYDKAGNGASDFLYKAMQYYLKKDYK